MHFRFLCKSGGLLLAILISSPELFGAEIKFDFGSEPINQQPKGFQSVVSGEGEPGEWRIIRAEVPPTIPSITPNARVPQREVLAQLSRDITDEHYPILVYTNEVFGDFTFTTRFNCVSGAVEQMAGLVFRYQDPLNYYYLRASAKGNTFRFFKVVAGQRSPAIGPEIEVPKGVWQELSVECQGNQIKCFLNGKQAIPTLTDNSFSSGRVGFWTKSDSVSYFVDSRITYTPRESLAQVLLREMIEKYPRVLGMKIYGVPPGKQTPEVIASTEKADLNQAGTEVEENVLANGSTYFGRLKPGVVVTLPLRDRNGDLVAALRVEMKSFLGQTENNAVARALPIAQDLEKRIVEAKYLF